jgi:hypothetical protein
VILKNLEIILEKIYPSVSLLFFVDVWMRKGSHQITVDELQRRGGPLGLPFLKILLRMFANNTSLTNSF